MSPNNKLITDFQSSFIRQRWLLGDAHPDIDFYDLNGTLAELSRELHDAGFTDTDLFRLEIMALSPDERLDYYRQFKDEYPGLDTSGLFPSE